LEVGDTAKSTKVGGRGMRVGGMEWNDGIIL
jgi:hypothetical protein